MPISFARKTNLFQVLLIIPLLFSQALTLTAQTIVPVDPMTGADLPTGMPLPSWVKFRVDGLSAPPPSASSSNFPSWGYFWDFGDCSDPGLEQEPSHVFSTDPNTDHTVTLHLTPLYSDDDQILTLTYPQSGGGGFAIVTSPFPLQRPQQLPVAPGRSIRIIPVRDPSPNQLVTYLIPFQNQTLNTLNGTVRVSLPEFELHLAPELLNGCGYDSPHLFNTNSNVLSFPFSNLERFEQRTIHATFNTDISAPVGTSFPIIASLYDDNGAGNLLSADTLTCTIVDSQDPNDKLVDEEEVCPDDLLNYTIRFENIGNSTAELVTLIDHLDTLHDIKSFQLLQHSFQQASSNIIDNIALDENFNPLNVTPSSTPHLTVILDSANAKLAFLFHDIHLAAKDEPGSEGFVSYSLGLADALPLGRVAFGQHADIYFDDNSPISTAPARSKLIPCYCFPESKATPPAHISEVKINQHSHFSKDDSGYVVFKSPEFELYKFEPNSFKGIGKMEYDAKETRYWNVWVDANLDGQFSNSELIISATGEEITDPDFFIPDAFPNGTTALRVSFSLDGAGASCGAPEGGETEDYTVKIIDQLAGDLHPLPPLVGTGPIALNSSLTMIGNIQNAGPATVASSGIRYLLSEDPEWSVDDLLLKNSSLTNLATAGTYLDTVTVQIPDTTGTWYVLAIADPQNLLAENNEENNVAFRQIRIAPLEPDLRFLSARVCQPTNRAAEKLGVSFSIYNAGTDTAYAHQDSKIQFYYSLDAMWDNTDLPLSFIYLPELAPGEIKHLSTRVQSTSVSGIAPGTYYLLAKADAMQNISESNESNNVTSIDFEVVNGSSCQPPYATGFECGGVDVFWDLFPNTTSLLADIGDDTLVAQEGKHFLVLGAQHNNVGVGKADLEVDLAPSTVYDLSFFWRALGNVSKNNDGLFLSDNGGGSWTKIYTFPPNLASINAWHSVSISLDSLDSIFPFQLSSNTVLRFQFEDTSMATADGIAIDNLSITSSTLKKESIVPSESPKQPLHVFPNPVYNQGHISYEVLHDGDEVSFSLFDMLGHRKEIILHDKAQTKGRHTHSWIPSNLPDGIYLLRYGIGEESGQLKWIVLTQ